jgi:hypothetical protein
MAHPPFEGHAAFPIPLDFRAAGCGWPASGNECWVNWSMGGPSIERTQILLMASIS